MYDKEVFKKQELFYFKKEYLILYYKNKEDNNKIELSNNIIKKII
jgi:hypothetical protein